MAPSHQLAGFGSLNILRSLPQAANGRLEAIILIPPTPGFEPVRDNHH